MWLFDIFKTKKEKKFNDVTTTFTSAFNNYNLQSLTLKELWQNGTERQWQEALDNYYFMLRPEQRDIENYINNIDTETIKRLDENEFYDFYTINTLCGNILRKIVWRQQENVWKSIFITTNY